MASNASSADEYYRLFVHIENYTILSINTVNFFLNLISTIVFTNKQFTHPFNIFKYFLIKSLVDSIFGLVNILVYIAFGCLIGNAKLAIVRAHYFFVGVFSYVNILNEISAAILINLSIRRDAIQLAAKCPDYKLVNFIIGFISVTFNLVRIIQGLYFTSEAINKASDPYDINYSLTLKWISAVSGWVRDCMLPSVLTACNIILLVQFNRNMQRKQMMKTNSRAPTTRLVKSRASIDLIKMALVIGIKCISGHLPLFLNRLNFTPISVLSSDVFSFVALILFYSSVTVEFFVFYYFNQKFQLVLIDYFNFIRSKIRLRVF